MPERFELGDPVRVTTRQGAKRERVWRVAGFRRWQGYNMVSIVTRRSVGGTRTEVGTKRDFVPDYALEHAEDAITRLGRLAKGI